MTPASSDPRATLTFDGGDAVVTGAAAGIGRATARMLVAAGIRTLRVDLVRPEPFSDLPAELQAECAVDVRDKDALARAFEEFLGGRGLGYVVNCAGILRTTGFAGVDREVWLQTLEVNLVGAYHVIDSAAAYFDDSSPSSIVNVTSLEASHVIALSDPDPTPHYAASKAALSMLTKTAARAMAATGTRVNSVAPGFVATAMAAAHGAADALPESLAPRVPLRRFADPDEIAWSIVFLLSDQASFITGAELLVDGGFSLT